jgi:DNA primase
LHLARQAAQKSGRLIVVEGYMDVVSLAQHGVDEAVATLGTATTRDHAELLFRNVEDVVYCFDGDRAGVAAAWRALESTLPRLKDGRQAHFLFLPEGEDPDSLIRKEGAAGFRARLDAAQALSDYFFATLERDVDMQTIDGRARLASRAKPLIETMPDGAFRDLMRQALADRSGAQRVALAAEPAQTPKPRPAAAPRTLVRQALALLLARPQLALDIDEPSGFERVDRPGSDVLRALLKAARERPLASAAELIEQFDGGMREALVKISLNEVPGDESAWREDLIGALVKLVEQSDGDRRQWLNEKLRSVGLDEAEKAELRALLARRI